MRKFIVCLHLFAFLISGCTFSYEVLTPVPPATDLASPQVTPDSTQPVASPIATISATAVPPAATLAAPGTDPIFFNGRSSLTADDTGKTSSFGPAVKRVYVIWDYQNMRAGMTVRREWYLNGQPWLTREDVWDFAKYGATGTVRDVSIFDETAGLTNGTYHLRIYIDNVVQPLGSTINAPVQEWVTFDVGAHEQDSFMGYGSPDGNWGVEVYGGNRVMLKNVTNGEMRQLVIVQEVPYVSWFNDSKHFLFVDRDRSEQKPGTTIGLRDHLWIVDVSTGDARRVFKGDNAFSGRWGPVVSPNGKYIASLFGSAYGDGCFFDTQMIFFQVSPDFQTVNFMYQQNFTGMPASNDSWFFPIDDGYWESDNVFRVTLEGTCNADKSKLGSYRFDLLNNTTSLMGYDVIPGDLGYGTVHGKVVDINGVPIPNAVVSCEHSSYLSGGVCTGSVTTNADGTYVFPNVFFHDTDTIKVTVQATGYASKDLMQTFFTANDFEASFVLVKLP